MDRNILWAVVALTLGYVVALFIVTRPRPCPDVVYAGEKDVPENVVQGKFKEEKAG